MSHWRVLSACVRGVRSVQILGAILVCSACLLVGCLKVEAAPGSGVVTPLNADCPLFFKDHDLCASITWTQAPSAERAAEFTLRFWNRRAGTAEAGPYVAPDDTVFAKLWMPAMGHGSSPVSIEPARDPSSGNVLTGVYEVKNVYFIMPGLWQVRVQLKSGDAVREEAILEISVN